MEKQRAKARPVYVSLPVWVVQTLEEYGERFNISVGDLVRAAIYSHHQKILSDSQHDPSKGGSK